MARGPIQLHRFHWLKAGPGALHAKLYATRNFCMHDFLKLHHNCDAYMGVQKERKRTFLTAFEHRQKESRSLFAAQY